MGYADMLESKTREQQAEIDRLTTELAKRDETIADLQHEIVALHELRETLTDPPSEG